MQNKAEVRKRMKRYYSHFAFIYPDFYLANCVVELNQNNEIIDIFRFEKEIANTSFYSGILLFIPKSIQFIEIGFDMQANSFSDPKEIQLRPNVGYNVYDENGAKIDFLQ